jgi:serine protease AprX
MSGRDGSSFTPGSLIGSILSGFPVAVFLAAVFSVAVRTAPLKDVMPNDNVLLPKLKIAPALRARFGTEEPRILLDVRRAYTLDPASSLAGEFSPSAAYRGSESESTSSGYWPDFPGARPARKSLLTKFDAIVSFHALPDDPKGGVRASMHEFITHLADRFPEVKYDSSEFYVRIVATEKEIEELSGYRGVEMIWPNNEISGHLLTSVETVRASACWRTFEARGDGITWAVLDTGINAAHPHFSTHGNIDANLSTSFVAGNPLTDPDGHGTHVAGIIAGAAPPADPAKPYTVSTLQNDNFTRVSVPLEKPPSGVAPMTKLISVQVLTGANKGNTFDCIRGLEYIRGLNQNSPQNRVDGANLSFGYDLEAPTYGCGNSPICDEVNRCVNAGICVVVSCGNSGYGVLQSQAAGVTTSAPAGIGISISDPANADLCIAVGSVHKSAPYKYGISYFSSKGPTLDGRQKPDMVAPGERIYSCCADFSADQYCERSGTSMAAPHVSGAIAAFLSVRPDFKGNPREVKRIFKEACVDLSRDRSYQGAGMVDAFKALTSV